MEREKLIKKAQLLHEKNRELLDQEDIKSTLAWLDFTGLLKTRGGTSYRKDPCLQSLLKAAEVEPRIYELLPFIMSELEFAVDVSDVPPDLGAVLQAIKANKDFPNYHYAKPKDYLQWFQSPAGELARSRLKSKGTPREVHREPGDSLQTYGTLIRKERIALGFTQEHFAQRFQVSLRVLRSLEQGGVNVGLDRVLEILKVFGRTLVIR